MPIYTGDEENVALTWLVAQIDAMQLAAGTTLPIFTNRVQEDNDVWPCIVIRDLDPDDDTQSAPGIVYWGNLNFIIEVIGKEAVYADLGPHVKRLFTALHRKFGPIAGGAVIACTRKRPFSREETILGINYQRLGHYWELATRAEE